MFTDKKIENTVNRLIEGKDYRQEIINNINDRFVSFAIKFFKKIVNAKMNDTSINLDWYKENFITNEKLKTDEIAVFSGTNKKTIHNIYGSAKKEVVIDAAIESFDYITNLVNSLESDTESNIAIKIKITYKDIYVDLNLTESLIIINALATKKIAIRGSEWSSIGKQIEKPLLVRMCEICNVPKQYMDKEVFKKDHDKSFDREIDFKFINEDSIYNVEVKLMGKGNPESMDSIFARKSHVFIADTLSNQNKNQLRNAKILFLELKGNLNVIQDFRNILNKLNIPNS